MLTYQDAIAAHYIRQWHNTPSRLQLRKSAFHQVSAKFSVLEFPPTDKRDMWTYATSGMSLTESASRIELHIFSSVQSVELVDILTSIAHYHQTEQTLYLGHTVNFGVPWQAKSICTYGLISLPYLDGPTLEKMQYGSEEVGCYWLLPITQSERDFKKAYGLEALEELFDEQSVNYVDALRKAVL